MVSRLPVAMGLSISAFVLSSLLLVEDCANIMAMNSEDNLLDDPAPPEFDEVLEQFCRERDIDLFRHESALRIENSYRRVVKSTKSIYPDEP